MFSLFDKVMFLAKGNRVFLGPPTGLEPFLSAHNFPVPENTAVAEHMLNVISDSSSFDTLLKYLSKTERSRMETAKEQDGDKKEQDADVVETRCGVEGSIYDAGEHSTSSEGKSKPDDEGHCTPNEVSEF